LVVFWVVVASQVVTNILVESAVSVFLTIGAADFSET
jgi:hypothetical protein